MTHGGFLFHVRVTEKAKPLNELRSLKSAGVYLGTHRQIYIYTPAAHSLHETSSTLWPLAAAESHLHVSLCDDIVHLEVCYVLKPGIDMTKGCRLSSF